jgi:hypothetical protein
MFSKIKSVLKPQFKTSPREEIQKTFQRMKSADSSMIEDIRQSLRATQALFNSRFGSLEGYKILSKKEKFEYLSRMLDLEVDLMKQSKFSQSIALKLFGLYLSTFLETNKSADDEVFDSAARVWVESFINDGIIP